MVYKKYIKHKKLIDRKHNRAVIQEKAEAFNKIVDLYKFGFYSDFAIVRMIETILNETKIKCSKFNKKYNNRLKSITND